MNGSFRNAVSRWWLSPAIARIAFDDATIVGAAADGDTPRCGTGPHRPVGSDPTRFGRLRTARGNRTRRHGRRLSCAPTASTAVALKLLSAGPWASEALIEILRNEAQYAARLQHPNIVVVHGMGETRRAGVLRDTARARTQPVAAAGHRRADATARRRADAAHDRRGGGLRASPRRAAPGLEARQHPDQSDGTPRIARLRPRARA